MPGISKYYFFVLIIGSLAISSCKKEASDKPGGVDVYVVGYTGTINGFANGTKAMLWKNGVGTQLFDAANSLYPSPYAFGVAVHNKDVYVVGTSFWKNGVAVPLNVPVGQEGCGVNAITIIGNDIYLAGGCTDSEENITPAYWKNGVPHLCTNTPYLSYTTGIAVYGNDVYMSGYTESQDGYTTLIRGAYWKNGAYNHLAGVPNEFRTIAYGLAVDASGVYFSGFSDDEVNYYSLYWKNGVATVLPNSNFAYGMQKNNNDTYILLSGTNTVYSGMVWKNGVDTNLPGADLSTNELGTPSFYSGGIFLNGNDVYVAGDSFSPVGIEVATYWKNNVPTALSQNILSHATAITVAPSN